MDESIGALMDAVEKAGQTDNTIFLFMSDNGGSGNGGNAPLLTNRTLFQRDKNLCLYCGRQFSPNDLTRDHIVPASRGGDSIWENCVTACRNCNQYKDDRTPEEAGMKLLAVPYIPNLAQYLILSNRRILADQMEFLLAYARKKDPAAKLAS